MGPSTRQLMLLDVVVSKGGNGQVMGGGGGLEGEGGISATSRPLLVEMSDPRDGAQGGGFFYAASGRGARGLQRRSPTRAPGSSEYDVGHDDYESSEEEEHSLPYMAALGSFRRRCAYANAINDFLVAYETSAMDPDAATALRLKKQKQKAAAKAAVAVEKSKAKSKSNDGNVGGWGDDDSNATAGKDGGSGGWGGGILGLGGVGNLLSDLGLSRKTTGNTLGNAKRGAPRIADERDHVGCSSTHPELSSDGSGGAEEFWLSGDTVGLYKCVLFYYKSCTS
jgi:hypothetical protein